MNPPVHQPIKKNLNEGPTATSSFKISIPRDTKAEMDGGPDPGRVPGPEVPRKKRRIHFSDDKGLELVHIKEIESCLANSELFLNVLKNSIN